MQKEIHPQYHKDAKITCVCGKSYKIGSTSPEIKVEICANCHPFYTGSQQLIDSTGRVERFKARASKVQPKTEKKPRIKKK